MLNKLISSLRRIKINNSKLARFSGPARLNTSIMGQDQNNSSVDSKFHNKTLRKKSSNFGNFLSCPLLFCFGTSAKSVGRSEKSFIVLAPRVNPIKVRSIFTSIILTPA